MPEITETRETALFRATGERGHEAAQGRKAPQIAPKREISAFLENTMGSKKPTSKRYSLGISGLWRAEGLPLIGRVSAVVRMSYRFAV